MKYFQNLGGKTPILVCKTKLVIKTRKKRKKKLEWKRKEIRRKKMGMKKMMKKKEGKKGEEPRMKRWKEKKNICMKRKIKGGEVTDHLEKEKEEQIEHEEDEQNEEANSNETNDEDRKVGDDEVDEHDREKIEGEADPDGEFMDEEKEREDDGEKKESQGNEDGQDHDGSGKNSHVAREEHYMADDASSAVTHDTQIISTEPEKEGLEKSNEKLAPDDLQQDKYSINDNPLDVNGDKNNSTSQLEQAGNGHSMNAMADEKKNDVTSPAMSEEGSPNNTTVTVLSSDQSVSSNKSTEVSSEAGDNQVSENLEVPGTSQQNGMLNVSESTQIRNATVDGQVTGDIANLQTTQSEQVNDGINSSLVDLIMTIKKPEVTATEDVNSGFSSGTNETKEATHDENSDTIHESGGRDENTDSSTTNETVDAVIHDPNDSSDSSIGQDEKEARIDLDTLPEFWYRKG
ncbi:hypothetical protein OIU85_001606 [Salix viminalis]|uniref:Uncharacterized protein n=1 Tax=Salix viminalis TaxID=40686 RepID=A0A9Q0VM40_SALVM|nr:hypothetical protein OIU85_001606 [Salix viminalis]